MESVTRINLVSLAAIKKRSYGAILTYHQFDQFIEDFFNDLNNFQKFEAVLREQEVEQEGPAAGQDEQGVRPEGPGDRQEGPGDRQEVQDDVVMQDSGGQLLEEDREEDELKRTEACRLQEQFFAEQVLLSEQDGQENQGVRDYYDDRMQGGHGLEGGNGL